MLDRGVKLPVADQRSCCGKRADRSSQEGREPRSDREGDYKGETEDAGSHGAERRNDRQLLRQRPHEGHTRPTGQVRVHEQVTLAGQVELTDLFGDGLLRVDTTTGEGRLIKINSIGGDFYMSPDGRSLLIDGLMAAVGQESTSFAFTGSPQRPARGWFTRPPADWVLPLSILERYGDAFDGGETEPHAAVFSESGELIYVTQWASRDRNKIIKLYTPHKVLDTPPQIRLHAVVSMKDRLREESLRALIHSKNAKFI